MKREKLLKQLNVLMYKFHILLRFNSLREVYYIVDI